MKNVLTALCCFFAFVSTNAQDLDKKNLYVQDGDLIKATIFHESGELSQTGFFTKEGKLTGEWISFNREGVKTAEGHYNNGAKVGTWFFWKEKTLTEVSYTDSKIAAINTWRNKETQLVSNE